MRIILLSCLFISFSFYAFGQDKEEDIIRDSLYIYEVEQSKTPLKILHAEPLYIDLIRDLGARKGESEWNIGLGMTDRLTFDQYEALVEYEWAPIDRLGLEIEVPVTIYSVPGNGRPELRERPSNRIESLKLAMQWTFLVSERTNTSAAIGYINELEFQDLRTISASSIFRGNIYNPFFIVAKRWGSNFHTLVYTGPQFHRDFATRSFHTIFEWHSNFHYMIPGTRNFVGIEFNKYMNNNMFDMVMRPQMRVSINDGLMIGIVPGIPISRERERLSSFLRLIYEPGHKAR